MPDLTDRILLVTGASGRLGSVVVRQLEAVGARVVALDRSKGDEGTLALATDVTDEGSVGQAFDTVEAELGTPDGLIHTVGMWKGEPFAETSLESWETVLRVNLTSTFLMFREAARRMQGRDGRLAGITSGQGADGGVAEQAAYSASKAGVLRVVESVAAEYVDTGLTAVALAPSTILFGDEDAGAEGVPVEAVANWCVRLCGPEAKTLNGQVVRAYGPDGA
ncbi:MAG: 3-oxoacyl-ACP reductase FabG [Rubricoccaceae bacterium]